MEKPIRNQILFEQVLFLEGFRFSRSLGQNLHFCITDPKLVLEGDPSLGIPFTIQEIQSSTHIYNSAIVPSELMEEISITICHLDK